MQNIDLNNPLEIRTIGMKALRDVLGPIGVVRFMQQFDLGYGDYTKERQREPDADFEQIDALLNAMQNQPQNSN